MENYHQNYCKLLQLIPSLYDMPSAAKLTLPGFTDVNVEIVEKHKNKLVVRLSHYLERLYGDAIPDPDMTIVIYPATETAGALTYRDCFGYRQVYCDELMAFSPLAKKDLNSFLEQWLTKMIEQGRSLCVAGDPR